MLAFVFFIAADLPTIRAVPLEPATPNRALAAALRERALAIADIEQDLHETLRMYEPPLRRFVDFVWAGQNAEQVWRSPNPCGRGDLIVWHVNAMAVRGRGMTGGEVIGAMSAGLWSSGGLPTLILWQDPSTGKLEDATLIEGEPFKDVIGVAETKTRQCPDLVVRRSGMFSPADGSALGRPNMKDGIFRLCFDAVRGYYDDEPCDDREYAKVDLKKKR